jgi:hypothetical protein
VLPAKLSVALGPGERSLRQRGVTLLGLPQRIIRRIAEQGTKACTAADGDNSARKRSAGVITGLGIVPPPLSLVPGHASDATGNGAGTVRPQRASSLIVLATPADGRQTRQTIMSPCSAVACGQRESTSLPHPIEWSTARIEKVPWRARYPITPQQRARVSLYPSATRGKSGRFLLGRNVRCVAMHGRSRCAG